VQNEIALTIGQGLVGHIESNPELAGRVHGQPPSARVPGQHRTLLNRLARIRDQRVDVDLGPHAQAVTGRASAVRVEGERFGAGVLEMDTANRADDLCAVRGDPRPDAVTVRAEV